MVKDILRELKHRWFQFVAILVITMLGVGFFIGIRVTGHDMRVTGDVYMRSSDMLDLEFRHTLGIDDEMLQELEATVKGRAVGVHDGDAFVQYGDNDGIMKIIELKEETQSDLTLVSGNLPTKPNEVVADQLLNDHRGFNLGDTLKIKSNDIFQPTVVTITGFAQSSLYMNLERGTTRLGSGNVQGFLYGKDLALKNEDLYTSARFIFERDVDYQNIKKLIESQEVKLGEARLERIKSPEEQKLNEAQAKVDKEKTDVLARLDSELKRLNTASNRVKDAQEELSNGIYELNKETYPGTLEQKLETAQRRFDQFKWEQVEVLKEKERDLNIAQTAYQAAVKEYESALAAYQKTLDNEFNASSLDEVKEQRIVLVAGIEELKTTLEILESEEPSNPQIPELKATLTERENQLVQMDAALVILEETAAVLSNSKNELDKTKAMLDSGRIEIQNAHAQLGEGEGKFVVAVARLHSGILDYNKAEQTLLEGQAAYASGREEALKMLQDAQDEIDSARVRLDDLEPGKAYVLERQDVLIGYKEFYQDSDRIEAIGQVFPLIFFGVAILVTLSTISRMIDESRNQIGVYKALGYSWYATSLKYVGFTGLAWFFGSVLGTYVGFYFIPRLIYNAYRIMYQTPELVTGFVLSYAWAPLLVGFISSVGVAMIKSMRVSRETTANLLRPPMPKQGQRIILERIPFIWKRLSFLYKVSLRNLFRNKARFLMTIVGIGGCCGLLITGFGLKHSIYSIVDKQFDELIHYDGFVVYDGDVDFNAVETKNSVAVHSANVEVDDHDVTLYVADSLQELSQFMTLNDGNTHQPLALSNETVVVSQKLATLENVSVGDSLSVQINNNHYSLIVGGISENYVGHYVYMSEPMYEQVTHTKSEKNMLFFNTDADTKAFSETLLLDENVYNVSFVGDLRATYRDTMGNFDIVIYVVVGAAFALELIVLLNLITMNISERYKELATLKVLGFYPKELALYILRENIILTAISMVFGVIFGFYLHRFVIVQAELDVLMFNRELKMTSILVAVILTFVISILINIVMSRRANDVNMSEALKTFDA